jgi:deoxycytidylate deaminase
MPPCAHCAALIIQSGIKFVYVPDVEIPERWRESTELTMQMFKEAGVCLKFIKLDNV